MLVKPFMKYSDPDDLLQEAYLGFHQAVFAYVPGDTKFTTYLPYRVRKSCIEFLKITSNTKRIPAYLQENMKKYQSFVYQYRNDHGTNPDDLTIIYSLGLSQKRLDRIRQTIYEQNCISIHEPVSGTEDVALEDVIQDETDIEAEYEEKAMQEYTRKVLDEAIADLPKNQAEVITSRYWNDETQVHVAERMGCSSVWVSQLERKALKKLKSVHAVESLMEQNNYDSQIAYRVSRKKSIEQRTSSTEQLAIKRMELGERLKNKQDSLGVLFSQIINY